MSASRQMSQAAPADSNSGLTSHPTGNGKVMKQSVRRYPLRFSSVAAERLCPDVVYPRLQSCKGRVTFEGEHCKIMIEYLIGRAEGYREVL